MGSLSKPWLVGVPDPYDTQSPYHRWTLAFSAATLDRALGAPGSFKRLKVVQRGVSPRVVRARVIGTRGSRTVTGPQVRAALNLRDTWFTHYRVRARRAAPPRQRVPRAWGPPPPPAGAVGAVPADTAFAHAAHRARVAFASARSRARAAGRLVRTHRAGRYRVALSSLQGVYRPFVTAR